MSFELDALQQVWLAQPTPKVKVDMNAVQRGAHRLIWRVRLRNATEWLASLLVAALFIPKAAAGDLPALSRVSCAAIVVAAIYISWRLFRDGRNRNVPNVEDGTYAYVRAYHDNLIKQADLLSRVPRWYLGPLAVGLTGFHAGLLLETPERWLPIMLSVGITTLVFIAVGVINQRASVKLRSRAEALASNDDLAIDDHRKVTR